MKKVLVKNHIETFHKKINKNVKKIADRLITVSD